MKQNWIEIVRMEVSRETFKFNRNIEFLGIELKITKKKNYLIYFLQGVFSALVNKLII